MDKDLANPTTLWLVDRLPQHTLPPNWSLHWGHCLMILQNALMEFRDCDKKVSDLLCYLPVICGVFAIRMNGISNVCNIPARAPGR